MRTKKDTRGADSQYDQPLATAAENTLVPHSPLPWTVASLGDGDAAIRHSDDGCVVWSDSAPSEADAEFIVRAVNNHDALLAALNDLWLWASEQRAFLTSDPLPDGLGEQVMNAIAKAETR